MSARPIASGTVSFGLVAIPVKLYSTGESAAGVRFNMLHGKCGTPVKQRYYCPTDEEYVDRKDIVKGYEYGKGQYVLFSDEELKALTPEPTNTIEITEFVPISEVDPVYYDKAYYLGPDKGGARPYRLLAKAMAESGRAGLARYAARGKDYLVLLRPFQEGLIMQQLRYPEEIRSFSEVPLGDAAVKASEMKLALQLVEQIASDTFAPEQYKDQVRERVMGLIERKVEGEEIAVPPAEEPKAQIIDLMEALKASLGDTARKPPRRAPKQAVAKKAAAAGGRAAAGRSPGRSRKAAGRARKK